MISGLLLRTSIECNSLLQSLSRRRSVRSVWVMNSFLDGNFNPCLHSSGITVWVNGSKDIINCLGSASSPQLNWFSTISSWFRLLFLFVHCVCGSRNVCNLSVVRWHSLLVLFLHSFCANSLLLHYTSIACSKDTKGFLLTIISLIKIRPSLLNIWN